VAFSSYLRKKSWGSCNETRAEKRGPSYNWDKGRLGKETGDTKLRARPTRAFNKQEKRRPIKETKGPQVQNGTPTASSRINPKKEHGGGKPPTHNTPKRALSSKTT